MAKMVIANNNTIIVDSSYTKSKGGIIVSFAFPVGANEIEIIVELGKMFVEYIQKDFGKMLSDFFFAKTQSPVVFSKGEELFMVWAFVARDDEKALKEIKKRKIKEISYE